MQCKLNCALMLLLAAKAAGAVQILPTPQSDRTFQFVHKSQTFLGTPLQTEALTPHALIVVGAGEQPSLYLQAATMAYMIGQWTQEPGTSLEKVKPPDAFYTMPNTGRILAVRVRSAFQRCTRKAVAAATACKFGLFQCPRNAYLQ